MKKLFVALLAMIFLAGCEGETRNPGMGAGQVACSDVQDQITATDFCKAIDLIEKNKIDCPNLNSDLSSKVAKTINDSGILGAQLTMLRPKSTFSVEDLVISSAYSALLPLGCYSSLGATWLACNFGCANVKTHIFDHVFTCSGMDASVNQEYFVKTIVKYIKSKNMSTKTEAVLEQSINDIFVSGNPDKIFNTIL